MGAAASGLRFVSPLDPSYGRLGRRTEDAPAGEPPESGLPFSRRSGSLTILGPLHAEYGVDGGEASATARAAPSALDTALRSPRTGRGFTLRHLFEALRLEGIAPHPLAPADDEAEAERILAGTQPAWTGTEEGVMPLPWLGVAEGLWARDVPATPECQATLAGDYTSFQAEGRRQYGDALNMARDVARMGAGRVRRVKQCDLYHGCVFPANELDGDFFQYGAEVPEPEAIRASMAGTDGLSGAPYGRLAATTRLLIVAFLQGVKVDLSPFNGGGGMELNYVPESEMEDLPIPESPFSESFVTYGEVAAGMPSWQNGVLVPSGYGWSTFYWEHSPPDTVSAFTYQRFALNVWPTEETPTFSTDYARECRRRKCLGVAAFAWSVGEWLAGIDRALQRRRIARIEDVVEIVEIGNELEGFWEIESAPDSSWSAYEVGRYMALLAGPIHHHVPGMRFRFELHSWAPSAGADLTNYPAQVEWLRRTIAVGMRAEVERWWDYQRLRAVYAEQSWGTLEDPPSPDPLPAWVADWEASIAAAGFEWPPPIFSSGDDEDTIQAAIQAGRTFRATDLIHEVGFHWYHDATRNQQGTADSRLFATSSRMFSNLDQLRDDLTAPLGLEGFELEVTVGEIGFPACDPGHPRANPYDGDATTWGTDYYAGTSEAFQAAMHLRYLLTCLAGGAASANLYCFAAGAIESESAWPFSFRTWNYLFGSFGLRNDVYDPDPAMDPNGTLGAAEYQQGVDCWPRPTWFTFRRLVWLLRVGSGAHAHPVSLVEDRQGLVVIGIEFPSPLRRGPDGEFIGPQGDSFRGWDRAYVIWLDQTADDPSHRYPTAGIEAITLAFRDADGTHFRMLSMVPQVTPPPDDDGAWPVDENGYAEVPAGQVDWNWDGWDAALADQGARSGSFFLRVRRAAPDDASDPVLAPVCVLTNARYARTIP